MPENLNKRRILEYLKAGYAGDIARAATYYDDDIDFIGYAPIDVFPTLGQRFGKAAMIDTLVRMHALYQSIQYDVTTIVAEDNRVAAMLDLRMYVRVCACVARMHSHPTAHACASGADMQIPTSSSGHTSDMITGV